MQALLDAEILGPIGFFKGSRLEAQMFPKKAGAVEGLTKTYAAVCRVMDDKAAVYRAVNGSMDPLNRLHASYRYRPDVRFGHPASFCIV